LTASATACPAGRRAPARSAAGLVALALTAATACSAAPPTSDGRSAPAGVALAHGAGPPTAIADEAVPSPRAKRAGPPSVAPVTIGEVKFAAIPWGKARGLGQNGGYVAALDPASGKELWTLRVYEVRYDPRLEGDLQDVFITSLAKSASGRELVVTDERGRTYLVDPATRSVRPQ
jgi:hypothetical protein